MQNTAMHALALPHTARRPAITLRTQFRDVSLRGINLPPRPLTFRLLTGSPLCIRYRPTLLSLPC